MSIVKILVVGLAILCQGTAFAGTEVDALTSCLADNTSGKDRKDMARWIFTAMASHPDMKTVAPISENVQVDAQKRMGAIVTRLFSENCTDQARAAIAKDGNGSIFLAFKSLGELAMQELMANKNVSANIAEYAKYLDQKKIDAALAIK